MSNIFYTLFNPLIAGTVAKSSDVNTQLAAIDVGFELVESYLNRAIKFPSDETDDQTIVEGPTERQGFLLGFDLSGNLLVTDKFLIDWDMDSKRLRNLVSPVATDEPVTLGFLNAYSASLVAGLPSITAQNGPLTTDGATVIWDSVNRLLPSTSAAQPSSGIVFSGGLVSWVLVNQNSAIDPNGLNGSAYWTTTLNNVSDVGGAYWRNTGSLTTQTFDHKPSSSGYITCGASVAVTAAVTIDTTGTTAGSIGFELRYFDSGNVLIGTSTSTPVSMASPGDTRYVVNATTPSLTAYIWAVVVFTGVSATASGIKLRDLKVERGTKATAFTDDTSVALVAAASASNPFGYGFASPSISLGDATATTAVYNFRSTSGAQAYDARIKSTGGTSGTAGKGTMAIESASLSNTGPIGYASEFDAGNSGASKTIDFLNGSKQKLTLSAATPAITVSPPPVVGQYQIKIVQDAGTARVPSWVGFSAADCVGGAFPVMTTTLGGVTFVYLYWDGTQFWVSSNQWN